MKILLQRATLALVFAFVLSVPCSIGAWLIVTAEAHPQTQPASLDLAPVSSIRINYVSTVNKLPVRVCQEEWATATRAHGTCNHLLTLRVPELEIEQTAGDTIEYVYYDGTYYERRNQEQIWRAVKVPDYRPDATINEVLFNNGVFDYAGVLTAIGDDTVATTIRVLAPTPTPRPFQTTPFSFTLPFTLPVDLPDTSTAAGPDVVVPQQEATPVPVPFFPTRPFTSTQPVTRPLTTPTPQPAYVTRDVNVPVRHFQYWSLDRQRNATAGGQFVHDMFVSERGYVYKEQFNYRGRFRSIGIAEVEEIWVYADPNAPVIVAEPPAEQVRAEEQRSPRQPAVESDSRSWLRR